jgi:mono/diheme cytochrome c family protein
MKKAIVALLSGVIMNLAGALPAQAQSPPPSSKGLALTEQLCSQCHGLSAVFAQRKTLADWRRTVAEMTWRGAPILPGENELIANYLAAGFGPASPLGASATGAQKLPPGDTQPLVAQRCLQCHGAAIITSQRRSAPEWSDTVRKMIRLGMELRDPEVEAITAYLASHFGKEQ